MAEPEVGVTPYWELTFDADGDVDAGTARPAAARRSRSRASRIWSCSRTAGTATGRGRPGSTAASSSRSPALAPNAAARVRRRGVAVDAVLGRADPRLRADGDGGDRGSGSGQGHPHGLLEVFPGRATLVDQIARMLDQQPAGESRVGGVRAARAAARRAAPGAPGMRVRRGHAGEGGAAGRAGDVRGATAEMCRGVRAGAGGASAGAGDDGGERVEAAVRLPNSWDGAHELLRQATYFAMKRRAGTVGERGLGPVIGRLAARAPRAAGASRGAQLRRAAGVVRAARAAQGRAEREVGDAAPRGLLPLRVRGAAAARPRAGGVLQGQQGRVDGPLVCCSPAHRLGARDDLPAGLADGGSDRDVRPPTSRLAPASRRQVGRDGVRRGAGGGGHAGRSRSPTRCGRSCPCRGV